MRDEEFFFFFFLKARRRSRLRGKGGANENLTLDVNIFSTVPTCQRHAGQAPYAAVKVDRVADDHAARAALEDERLQRDGGDVIRRRC